MKTKYNNTGTSSLQLADVVLLFQSGVFESAAVNEMLAKAKQNYVDSHHSATVFQMHSSSKYKDGSWKTYVYECGKRKEVIRKTKDELYETLYDFYKNQERVAVTFEDAFKILMTHKVNDLGRCHNTIVDDSRYFSYLNADLRKKALVEITESDLRCWLVKEYMPTKPKEAALRKMLQLINQIFDHAISEKLCFDNPAKYILYKDYAKDCDHSKKRDEERAFSEAECIVLYQDALTHIDNPRCVMRLFSMVTGLRVGELSALTWDDVLDDCIHVHQQQIRDTSSGHQVFRNVGYTKDERMHPHDGREIPRNPQINVVLSFAEDLPGSSIYVFHDVAGNPISKDSYMQHLRRTCKRLGINTTNNHAFRIAYNSKLIENNFSSADRALVLGHAVQTNEQHYSVSDRRRFDSIKQRMAQMNWFVTHFHSSQFG